MKSRGAEHAGTADQIFQGGILGAAVVKLLIASDPLLAVLHGELVKAGFVLGKSRAHVAQNSDLVVRVVWRNRDTSRSADFTGNFRYGVAAVRKARNAVLTREAS